MENTELMTTQQGLYVAPVVPLEDAMSKFEQVRQYTAKCLTKDIDYGTFAGVAKPSLLKPGAEKIGSLFGLSARFECIDKILNFTGEGNPDNEPFFYFEYRCNLYKGEHFVGSCEASCNSWEKKYRYRKAEIVCPNCGKKTIIKGKKEYGGGWLCYGKKGGCGAKFADNDPKIVDQPVGEVKNYDTAEQVNTYQKMAQKRAYIGAILIVCNLSEYYTQDIEDMDRAAFLPEQEVVEGEYTPVAPAPEAPQAPQAPQPKPADEKKRFNDADFLRSWSEKASVIVGEENIPLPEIEMSAAVTIDTTNKDGTVIKMGDRKTGELAGMWKAYKNRLIDPAVNRDDVLTRLAAVNMILTSRAKTQAQLDDLGW